MGVDAGATPAQVEAAATGAWQARRGWEWRGAAAGMSACVCACVHAFVCACVFSSVPSFVGICARIARIPLSPALQEHEVSAGQEL